MNTSPGIAANQRAFSALPHLLSHHPSSLALPFIQIFSLGIAHLYNLYSFKLHLLILKGSYCCTQASLKLLGSDHLPAPEFLAAETTEVCVYSFSPYLQSLTL